MITKTKNSTKLTKESIGINVQGLSLNNNFCITKKALAIEDTSNKS
jgi:hypothetical protein